MSVEATHAYVVFSGGYNDGSIETWQFGVRFFVQNSSTTPDETGTLPTFLVTPATVARTEADWTIESDWDGDLGSISLHPDDWLNDQLAPAAQNYFGPTISNHVVMNSIKASPITSTGAVADLRTSVLTFTSARPQGAVSGNMLPPQDSVVVSTNTPRIGAHGRGRFYLPPCGSSVLAATGRLDTTPQGSLLAAVVSFLEGLAITDSISPSLWVLPAVIGAPWTAYGQITSIDIGNVIDTQRRRRRSLIEARSAADVSY